MRLRVVYESHFVCPICASYVPYVSLYVSLTCPLRVPYVSLYVPRAVCVPAGRACPMRMPLLLKTRLESMVTTERASFDKETAGFIGNWWGQKDSVAAGKSRPSGRKRCEMGRGTLRRGQQQQLKPECACCDATATDSTTQRNTGAQRF